MRRKSRERTMGKDRRKGDRTLMARLSYIVKYPEREREREEIGACVCAQAPAREDDDAPGEWPI